MKKLIIALAALVVSITVYGQGTIQFNNRIVGTVVAQVTDAATGLGLGAGFTAQLFAAPGANAALTALVGLTPTTTFRTSPAAALGYVNAVDLIVANIAPGATATIVMRAFNGTDYASSSIKGQSLPINV